MHEFPRPPEGWAVLRRRSTGPFTTGVTYEQPDGRRLEWSSRRHRKHASRLSRVRPGHGGILWAPGRASWWIAILFVAGATCFLVAPLPRSSTLSAPGQTPGSSSWAPIEAAVANATTSLGALAFLIGAVLLLPEGAREPARTPV